MPQLRFKNFSDLGFIQGIDKARFLAPLLEPHKDYLLRQGLDLTKLANTDRHDRQLLTVFTKPDEEMPPELLHTLYVLDDLADEAGHDRILAESERQGVPLDGIVGENLPPGDFAIAVQLHHGPLVHAAHNLTLFRKIKNYEEYQATGNKTLALKTAEAKREQLRADLAPWFEAKDRSSACEIHVYQEGHEIKFQITHGSLVRTDGTIDKKLKPSRVVYRPQKHDSVMYDRRTRVLKLNAQTAAEKNLYRKSIGRVFFEDENYFPSGGIYSLAPLNGVSPTLAVVDGLDGVRLTEVWIEVDDEHGFLQISRAYDLLATAKRHGNPNLAQGRIIRASFLIKYRSGGRARKLELRPPNVAIYDRARDEECAEAFMHANGILNLPQP